MTCSSSDCRSQPCPSTATRAAWQITAQKRGIALKTRATTGAVADNYPSGHIDEDYNAILERRINDVDGEVWLTAHIKNRLSGTRQFTKTAENKCLIAYDITTRRIR